MRLSARLMMSAMMVTPGVRVADVGCDHAHTSIWLTENGKVAGCIAMDLREGPLRAAAKNIKMCGYEDKIETRLSDGLDNLKPLEADCILISGMGGSLISEILTRGKATAQSASELVLQPQSDIDLVRRCVFDLGFDICEEACCVDYNKFYLSIHAKKGTCKKKYSECEIAYGRLLPAANDKEYHRYLSHEYRKALRVYNKLMSEDTEGARERRPVFEKKVRLLKEALDCFRVE
ncbi:MAG: SAM-dependent methyltransferase [Lachnospiraceae bacterium]|nr:SAM-dependent methyltransferase [Lachnospiraceae bacterium]